MRAFALLFVLALVACKRTEPDLQPDAGSTQAVASSPRVIVVGGGVAGLTAAYELEKAGLPIHLLEASDVLGGRVQTAYYGEGLDAEFGMQEMWEGNPLLDIAKALGVELDGEPEPPFSSLIIDGKLIPYVQPTTEAYFASFLDPRERKALAGWMEMAKGLRAEAEREGIRSARVLDLQAISFAAWLQRLRLPRKVSEWIRLTIECELAAGADQFSALAGLLEFGIFLGEGVPNFHVKGGNSKLIHALGEAIRSPKTMSALVTGIRRRRDADGKIQVTVTYLENNVVRTMDAERVVLAIPFFRIHQIVFEPPLDEQRLRGIQTLGLGQYTVVHFLVTKEVRPLFQIDGETVLPVLSDGPLGVIYGIQHESPDSQPFDVFSLLVYGLRARLFHMVPRELKVDEAKAELERLWPGFEQQVRGSHVYTYHPAALAVFPPGRSPLDELAEAVRQPDLGVHLAGDWTQGSHSDHAARSGIAAARAIAAELGAMKPPSVERGDGQP